MNFLIFLGLAYLASGLGAVTGFLIGLTICKTSDYIRDRRHKSGMISSGDLEK